MKALLVLASLLTVTTAHAHSFTLSSVNGGAALGATQVNFDDLALGFGGTQGVNDDLSVSFAGPYTGVVEGSVGGRYARPFLSGTNGQGFGPAGSDQANGANATRYLSVGASGVATLSFAFELDYFGLLWGSVDTYNWLEFYSGDTLVGQFNGSQIWANANGNLGAQGTFYVNFTDLSGTFNKVVAKSSGFAFEFDNIAYRKPVATPDAASTSLLAGVSLLGLVWLRRRR